MFDDFKLDERFKGVSHRLRTIENVKTKVGVVREESIASGVIRGI